MIYIKRLLWILGYLIMWLLSFILVPITAFFTCPIAVFFYIKNGDTQGWDNCIEWGFKLIEWYDGIEPKED